ncbi:cardiolipin-specific phospholipase [Schizosaccharomyces cryophilus OY26]|uniref:Cardiolipin-specific phospholipase n=1 Tax=Schizosaccharomyces cryophilus (strain OY26 / ATCC MYA-4695 / CBS 11777 / NBRC 106824 / NRRL Y48691) TaxID=653667 RepID=S9XEG0_SCHCR|nr:cardiolipin-specific phospholipase [Schizosaccharomyces cryophilus OY26]EPY52176.1 cardiolipin-specific phospholipase [Schizosaccharomyces cryophilus OY26]
MSQAKVASMSAVSTSSMSQTLRMSWRQWRTESSSTYAKRCEIDVLNCVDFIRENEKEPDRLVEICDFPIYENDGVIHELCVSDKETGKQNKKNVVYLHGYGAGLGFFFQNIDELTKGTTKRHNSYFVDWLGMGNSSRPPFKVKGKTSAERVHEAENFFVESLECWRIKHRIESMVLVGHSLGGYLSAVYAMRYPERVEKLMLVSPVGVPECPYATDDDAEEYPNFATSALHAMTDDTPKTNVANELLQTQDEISGKTSPRSIKPKNPLPRWITFLWEQNVTPFALLRFSGPLGPKLTSFWTSRRFSTLPENVFQALHAYCYSIFRLKGSSEYALGSLLAPGAFARKSIHNRLHRIKCRTIFMYGDKDWMDDIAGLKAVEVLSQFNVEAEHHYITNAGHHCYLDNPKEFNALVLEEIL